jgi:hypothetical protein
MTRKEAREERRQDEGSDVSERRDAQEAVGLARRPAKRGRRIPERRDVRRGHVGERAARLGQHRPLRHSTDQGDAEILLDTPDRPAHRRFGNAELLRRGRERTRLRDLDEYAELFEVRFLESFADRGHEAWLH